MTSIRAAERADPPTDAPTAPSGRQYAIAHGGHVAVITLVGATLREYTVRGRQVIDGFGTGQRATDGRGQVLAPWPNRLAAGRYIFGGRRCQAPLTEPERGNAIHGLVRWLDWAEIIYTANEVVLGCERRPRPGYEWQLHLEVGYRLAESPRSEITGGRKHFPVMRVDIHPLQFATKWRHSAQPTQPMGGRQPHQAESRRRCNGYRDRGVPAGPGLRPVTRPPKQHCHRCEHGQEPDDADASADDEQL